MPKLPWRRERRTQSTAHVESANSSTTANTPTPAATPAPAPAPAAGTPTKHDQQKYRESYRRGNYSEAYDNVDIAGHAVLGQFPAVPPPDCMDRLHMSPEKRNHVIMEYGAAQYDLRRGVRKGETASGYGDTFCQMHGITRVLVFDRNNFVIAMCSPMRYMAYMANRMYSEIPFQGHIFQFGGSVVATPRWAMRAAAWNILLGQGGNILRDGPNISVTASSMQPVAGSVPEPPKVVVQNVPYSGVSWVVMDKWMEDARMHKISLVETDTGLSQLSGTFDKSKTLPLVIREDEADMFMSEPVTGLVVQDDRFRSLVANGIVNNETKALQFRNGWYAPQHPSGVTRIMRILKLDETSNKYAPKAAYSKEFVNPPSHDLWVIGGVDNIDDAAAAKDLGTHLNMEGIHLEAGTGGFNTERTEAGNLRSTRY